MASPYCPDCGATVKFGERRCWMCNRLLPWANDADKTAAVITSSGRSAQRAGTRFQTNPWTTAGFVVAAILMVPAVAGAFYVTFFVTCLKSLRAHGPMGLGADEDWMMQTSIEVALVVFVGFVILLTFLGRSAFRKIPL